MNQVPVSTNNSLSAGTLKTDFITLFDCQSCGTLFASENGLKNHNCSGAKNSVKEKRLGKSFNRSVQKKAVTVKTKAKAVNATLTTTLLEDPTQITTNNNNEFTFQLAESLDDSIPTPHIEIIPSSSELENVTSFPSVVIDGVHYPILTNTLENINWEDT